jgi:uncharacterized membrane protein YraQ (UPF0718 family)
MSELEVIEFQATEAPTTREGIEESQVDWKVLWKPIGLIVGLFLLFFWLPVEKSRFTGAVIESLALAKWYAQEHVLLCLVPAFFIAGGISCFVSQAAVMKYLGVRAKKVVAYSVASVSGTILAVCSCTILPLFAGIWKRGAGIGPATAFLYSGPAINILAIILTARVLGVTIGIARAVGAIVFSIVIGLLMHTVFRKEEREKEAAAIIVPEPEAERTLGQNLLYFATMIGILVFATWGEPAEPVGLWHAVYGIKWAVTSFFAVLLGVILVLWFRVSAWKVVLAAAAIMALAVIVPHKPLPFRVGKRLGGREYSMGEPVCFCGWHIHVLRYPHRGADPTGFDGSRHGQRSRAGVAVGRSRTEPAEYAGYSEHNGD